MEEFLKWLSMYSLPVVILIVLGAGFVFILKMISEKAISGQFDKYRKRADLELERRSGFEEKILLDRYNIIHELHKRIEFVMTNTNRSRNGRSVKGFMAGDEIVSLTEVYESLQINRFLIPKQFYDNLTAQCNIALSFANAKDAEQVNRLHAERMTLLNQFQELMNSMFGLDRISYQKLE